VSLRVISRTLPSTKSASAHSAYESSSSLPIARLPHRSSSNRQLGLLGIMRLSGKRGMYTKLNAPQLVLQNSKQRTLTILLDKQIVALEHSSSNHRANSLGRLNERNLRGSLAPILLSLLASLTTLLRTCTSASAKLNIP